MEENKNKYLDSLIKTLPGKPGVYRYLDKEGNVIYVGKAKNLKKRVSSYFTKSHQSGRLRLLVRKIADIKFVVTDTESDALLLENNLIKKYQPKYNIQLKDDKSFPWICIKNEPFPKVFPTRNIIKDGSEYYGPYTSVKMMNTLLDIIKQLYPLRTCKLNLTPKNIEKKKFKVCLEYHIGNCMAPCVGKQTEEEYNKQIENVRRIIKGDITEIIKELRALMFEYAGKMEFEKAQTVKEKIEILENYKSKSTVVNPKISNIDVFSIVDSDDMAWVNWLKVVNGAIVQAHSVEVKKKLNETAEELLLYTITDFRQRFGSNTTEIVVPFLPDIEIPGVVFTVPKRGDKKQLLDLSLRNANFYRLERNKQRELVDPERHARRIMQVMKKDLNMNETPEVIECFDNSNFQGDEPVAAMVQFVKGKPNKKEYRHFNIKTVEGPNDFASMEEIIERRYGRLLRENKPLPQLIVIDGGKGQLSAAVKSLKKLGLFGKITIIGIAKKLEELYFPGDPVPLYLDKTSETLKVIQHIRDEAHRFGITHHRKRRDKKTMRSELTSIEGVGFATAQKLLRKFRSVANIKKASFDDLAGVVGKAKAKTVYDHFH